FYPYEDTVDGGFDQLAETLIVEATAERSDLERRIGTIGAALEDGHVFFADLYGRPSGIMNLALEHPGLQLEPVVSFSSTPGVEPGDTIVAVDGRPSSEIYQELLGWNGAGSLGYALDLCDRRFMGLDSDATLTLRAP